MPNASISGGNVSITDAPKHLQWSNEQSRLQSFKGWPAQMSQKPRELAQAGLFYMATGDRCKCFWCGGELYEWEPLNVPMEEHAKLFPNCNFVRQLIGADYIQYVKNKQHGLIVELTEFMSKPHVLAVLQSGHTHKQVQEVVIRNGVTKLRNANDIIRAIEETNQERWYSNNTTHHAVQPQSAPIAEDENVPMETEEYEVNQVEQAVNMTLSFDEKILEAAKSIANTIAALVKSAPAAQRELVAQDKVGATYQKSDTDDDGQWSQGLISVAKMVAAAAHSMCEAANTMVQGGTSEEKLIASAKKVAVSTDALLVECRVQADPGSKAMQRLHSAGNAVKRATEALVQAAQQAKAYQEDEDNLTINQRMVGGIAQVHAAQEEIIRKEKELEKARRDLAKIHQQQN